MGEPRIWFLTITADKDYPTKAPTLKFTSKIIMDCVDARGNVGAGLREWRHAVLCVPNERC